MTLTKKQRLALDLLQKASRDQDGYSGLMMTGPDYKIEDGTARIAWQTCEALARRGLVEIDRKFGRVRVNP